MSRTNGWNEGIVYKWIEAVKWQVKKDVTG